MQPRHLGIRVILVKSFARIHETNLKIQGMLALTFANESDYDNIKEDDTIDSTDLTSFSPDKQLTLQLKHKDGSSDIVKANHSYNAGQIEWFKAGSALNNMSKGTAASNKKAAGKASRKTVAKKKSVKKVATKSAKKTKKKTGRKVAKKASKKVVRKSTRKTKKTVSRKKARKAQRKRVANRAKRKR
jgi:aconitate hydratase